MGQTKEKWDWKCGKKRDKLGKLEKMGKWKTFLLLHTYIAANENALPTCLVFHSPDFAILKTIVNDRSFLNQEWITRLNDFLNRRPVPGMRPLICIAASEFKKLGFKEEQLEKIPKVLLQVLFHHWDNIPFPHLYCDVPLMISTFKSTFFWIKFPELASFIELTLFFWMKIQNS